MSQRGAPAAYRGYRLQALYTLKRILAPAIAQNLVFHLEGREDLDIREADNRLVEVIQVKSYENLVLSDLSPSEPNSFFHRTAELLRAPAPPDIKLVNFRSVGPEMRQAWAGDEPQRTQVAKKLRDNGFEESDIEAIFTHVKLIELDEAHEEASVFSSLQDALTGVDPESAFDLLNFWLYTTAEQRATVTRSDLIEKINSVGCFLAERHTHHTEWFTSITPIIDQDIPDDQRSWLQEEFYAGVATRYEHILAELDFRRGNKLAEIAEKLESRRVVIIHGASGQGKTALAYRYLHDAYPEKWRFSIELIENRQHALRIARALAGHANAVQTPMAIYVDVSPHDAEWPEVVKRLARYPHFQILVSIREEDFRRANISGAEFDYDAIELDFDEAEARLIYERAIASGQGRAFLDFDEAWDKFGGSGPLMEFVYLLTQTTTLRERLQGQVNRIRNEVRSMRAHPDELGLLRLVSVASAYEARLHVPNLINELHLPDPDHTLKLFEKEYLLRLSSDRRCVQGLHPIRSRILADLLTSPDVAPWLEAATQALPLMIEDDLESFILHAFIDRPSERARLPEITGKLEPTTWAGLACILRILLWAGVHDYIESNMPAIEAAREEFGQGWWFAVDLDLMGLATTASTNWWTQLGDLVPPERQARIEEIRAKQTSKEDALQLATAWLAHLKARPVSPSSTADWSGVAELCFWGTHLGVAPHIERWLSDDDLACAAGDLALPQFADLSLALYMSNKERHTEWIQANLPILQTRLAQEYSILCLEEQDNVLKLHFLPLQFGFDGDEQKTSADGQISSDPFHEETMDRIRLVRGLFPNHEAYGSQGCGYRMGILPSLLDSSINKEGVPVSALPPTWLVRVNSIAYGLGHNRFRPDTWPEYVEQVLEMRQLTVTCLEQLLRGLIKYLQRSKAVNLLEKHVDMTLWHRCWASVGERPLLPKSAVDPWGFAHEFSSGQRVQSPEQQAYLPKAIALQKYKPYLDAERDYTFSLANFFQQSPHVMLTNFYIGKLPAHSPERDRLFTALQKQGIKTDLAHLTTHNLATAKDLLPTCQWQFRVLFGHIGGNHELTALQEKERDLISLVWQLWYFFANDPGQGWATPLTQIPAKIRSTKQALEIKIQRAIDRIAVEGTRITILHHIDSGWDGAPTLWLRLDLENPTKLYVKFEELVVALREAIGHVEFQELAHYMIGENWEYIAIVPVVRGRMLNHLAWRLLTFTTILSDAEIGEKVWLYIPQPIPSANWEELGLALWDVEDIRLANQLSEAVAGLSILAAQLSDLRDLPDLPESGEMVLRSHVEKQAEGMNECLQAALDAMTTMANRFNDLSEKEQQERADLREAMSGLIEMRQLVLPSEDFDGAQALSIEEVLEYAQRLEQARPLAEGAKLFWSADVLAHMA